MVAKKQFNKHGSNRPVKRFNGSVELGVLPEPLPKRAMDILGVLGAQGVAAQAAIIADVTKSDVSWWVKRFVRAGALVLDESQSAETLGKPRKDQKVGPGYPKYYSLTAYGSKLLTGSDSRLRLPIVLEDRALLFRVLGRERSRIDWRKLGDVRNWRKLGVSIGSVTVELHDRLGVNHDRANVLIHPGAMKGFNVDELEMDAARVVERVKFILESKFGMRLSEQGEPLRSRDGRSGPRWQVFRPECRQWVEAGTVDVPGVGALDASPKLSKGGVRDPLSNVPHVEFNDKRHAAIAAVWPPPVASDPAKRLASAAPMYPLYMEEVHAMVTVLVGRVEALTVEVGSVKQFEGQVSEVIADLKKLTVALSKLENLDKIGESLQRISGLLGQLFDVEGDGKASKGDGGQSYVS